METKKKNPATPWRIAAIVLAVALIAVSCTWAITANTGKSSNECTDATEAVTEAPAEKSADALSLWTDSAPLKAQLTEYMKAVTAEDSNDFIPVADRIAVFDMDGTLCCETDPGYFDHKLLYHRVMEDPDYKD